MPTDIAASIDQAEQTAAHQDRLASRWRLLPPRARAFRRAAQRYREIAAAERARAARLASRWT